MITRQLVRSSGHEHTVDVFAVDNAAHPIGRTLIASIEIRVRNHGVWWRCASLCRVIRRVRIADPYRVIPTRERAMQRRADAHVRLRAGHDKFADPEPR